ncbi:unnamed protein product [Peronospora destructor]|uniref:WRKY19-like zinc finger domain-containing protein n=1 Tax=Peronospora destructor TaxID=86335 RepID=A0AAV0TXZ8_9STRA|nr:unnamed protein product [Peronospora destructor]
MNATWLQQVASADESRREPVPAPTLELAASRHRLAAIMNRDDVTAAAASKSSLAFILGGNTVEDQAHLTRRKLWYVTLNIADEGLDLQMEISAFAQIDHAFAGFIHLDAFAANLEVRFKCLHDGEQFDNCTRYVVNRGLCIGHGGGKQCAVVGCTSSAKNLGVCWKHGGSTKCTMAGCENRAKSRGVCWSHGGGRKCSEENCIKTAVSHGLCWAHGGGKRCVVEGCRKPAYERNGNVCSLHQAIDASALQKSKER